MIEVTEIKKLRGNRYLIKINKNNQEYIHIVTEDTILKHNLLGPKKLSNKDYDVIIKSGEKDLLYSKALFFIEYQMRTISEVKKHLKKQTKDEKVIDELIKKLKDQGYLNDDHYTKEFVNEKMEFDLIGPKQIKEKLISKGIHFDLIDKYLVNYTRELEYKKIEEILKKETKYPFKKPYIKVVNSLKAKLINKGFKMSIIDEVLNLNKHMIAEKVNEEPLLEKELTKLKKQYKIKDITQKDKVIKKLLQQGFSYELIKRKL